MTDPPDKAARRVAGFDVLIRRLEKGAPELVPFARDLAAAAMPGEWNAVVARLVAHGLNRAARGEGREDNAHSAVVGHLSFVIAQAFIAPAGRPSSVFNAEHDAMILEAEEAKTMPEAVAVLARWEVAGGRQPAPVGPPFSKNDYDRLAARVTKAAKIAGIKIEPGKAFDNDAVF